MAGGGVYGGVGVAAAEEQRHRRLRAVSQTFKSEEDRRDALKMLDLIIECKVGNPGISIMLMILGIPSMGGGMWLGGKIAGELGQIIGTFAGLGLLAGGCIYLELSGRRVAREQLRQLVASRPEGESIAEKVREIYRDS